MIGERMEHSQRHLLSSPKLAGAMLALTSSRIQRFQQNHPARSAVLELFNLYLGRSNRHKVDEADGEQPIKAQKRIHALNRELPPSNEQFVVDFEQLRTQFPDQDQLRGVTESVLISLVVECSSHAPRSDFLLFSIRTLCSIGCINLDTFLPLLLSVVSSTDVPGGHLGMNSANSQPGVLTSSLVSSQPSVPTSPLTSVHGTGSPSHSGIDVSSRVTLSPAKHVGLSDSGHLSMGKSFVSMKDCDITSLRQLCCKIILAALESKLKPITYADIFQHMLNWLVNGDQKQQGSDDYGNTKTLGPEKSLLLWLHSCLDVIWLLTDVEKCRVPFYELIRSDLQFIENMPNDEALFALILEIHRRRDQMAMHMLMLDQHLHCPTFGTPRILGAVVSNIPIDAVTNLRLSPITYPSVLGEPLHGEDLANSIQKGSLDWERALRCLRHALQKDPSPDWWKRVLLIAPCHKQNHSGPIPGAVFSYEMLSEAAIDRIVELLKLTNLEINCWQEWLILSDILYFLLKNGCIDFADFVDKLVVRFKESEPQTLRTNHVSWLIVQVIRIELVINALSLDSRKIETTKKILSFHRDDRGSEPKSSQSVFLDYITSSLSLRIWSMNILGREHLSSDHLQKGKLMDEWWKQVGKDRGMDCTNMDERFMGMFWAVSYTMAQPVCEAMIGWFSSSGVTDVVSGINVAGSERMTVLREVSPLSMTLLSGLSINLCNKLVILMEDSLFAGQNIPSIALVESYCRLQLIAPHALFRAHLTHLPHRYPSLLSKPGLTIMLLEIVNYRLLPLYRYEGKSKQFMFDVTKILSTLKGKRGDHRVCRLAENLCMNLVLSQKDFFTVKRDGKGPTEFTETLNRITIISLAIISKTRGFSDAEHIAYLQTMVEQITATSQHTWSEKTLRHFSPLLREILAGRMDKRGMAIQAWQQAETTVINQCNQLLSPSADPSYVATYINHSFFQHRQYLCAGAWILMHGHVENINCSNLARVLREFSPEEVTANIYMMVDVLLHHIHVELQLGHPIQDLLIKSCANLVFFVWTHELLPLDILLLALIDRDDDPHALRIVFTLLDRQELQQRIKVFFVNRGPPEHWLSSTTLKRQDLHKALGNHLSWKERYPTFFDDIVARLLPVIPLIIYRLIENEAMDMADRVLVMCSPLLSYHPLRFTFVRDILAYFYGHLPGKLIVRILNVLDLSKIPFSESFAQHISSSNPSICPPPEYFTALLLGIVNHVIPPLSFNSKCGLSGDSSLNNSRSQPTKSSATSQSGFSNAPESQKPFYQIQDPGTNTQLVLDTAVMELLSVPVSASQIVSSLVQIIVNIPTSLIQSSSGTSSSFIQGQGLPTSPSAGSTESQNAGRSGTPVSGFSNNYMLRSGYTSQQLACLIIQACGLLLAHLPPDFHSQLYMETTRVITDTWWLADSNRPILEQNSAVGYALLDPTWAAQDNTSTAIGNIVALLHSLFSNLPHEWVEGTLVIVKNLRPLTSVAMLRIAFRIMGPLLPRLINAHTLFNKTLSLLLSCLVDVYGRNSPHSSALNASEITDIVDFLHHIVHYDGQGGPVQTSSKPRPEVLALFATAAENFQPDLQHLLSHLKPDPTSSIYAATHPKLADNPS